MFGRRITSKTLVRSVWLLALISVLSVVVTRECQPLFIGVFTVFFVIGVKIEKFSRLANMFGTLQPYLAAVFFAVSVVDFFFLSNSFLLTVAHFLLSIQGLRLLALRTNRECLGSLLLSSLTMLSASTLSVEWTFFVFLFGFLLVLIWTLILLTVIEESKADDSMNGAGLVEETFVWRQVTPVLRAASLCAFLLAMLCCSVVFLVFPRFNFQGFRGQFLQPVHKTGFSSQVDLAGSGRIFSDESVVMRVEIDRKDQPLWTGYLRGRTLDTYASPLWKKSPDTSRRIYRAARNAIALSVRNTVFPNVLHQRIYLESMDSSLLFMHAAPASVSIERPFLEEFPDGSVQRNTGDTWRVKYEANSIVSLLDPLTFEADAAKVTRSARGFDSEEISRNLMEVPSDQKGRLRSLANRIIGNTVLALGRARKINAYLRTRYAYTLDIPAKDPKKDPVATFLFETKKGNCEYFASAMCLLLRAEKIPARMVTGFLSREWNAHGSYYVVRSKHAHAWVEAYIEPYGWVGFDPSPRVTETLSPGSALIRRWSEWTDEMNLKWNRYILSYDFERQVEIVKSVSNESGKISFQLSGFAAVFRNMSHLFRPGSTKGRFANGSAVATGYAATILVLAIGMFVVSVIAFFRRRSDEHVWFYRAFLRRLETRIGKKSDTQTLQEFVLAGREKLGLAEGSAFFLMNEYHRLRFGGGAGSQPIDRRVLREKLREI